MLDKLYYYKAKITAAYDGDTCTDLILDKEVYIQTIKDKKGKYGRYLGDIWLINEDESLSNINDLMVSSGFAEYKEY